MRKASVDEIRNRFDNDVERFSDLNKGQQTAIDGALCLDLIADGAARVCPNATASLDVGCGAGNWTLRLLERLPHLAVTMIDLSQPMLDRAKQRVIEAGATRATTLQRDVRECDFAEGSFDLIVAGAVLHHLRGDDEWDAVARLFHRWLRPGGAVFVYDMVSHEVGPIARQMTDRYADYLRQLGGDAFVQKVFDYIEAEDSPRPVTFQLDRLRAAGFGEVDVLHKSGPFAAYVARKE